MTITLQDLAALSEKATQGEWPVARIEPQTASGYIHEPFSPWFYGHGPRPVTGDKGAVVGIHADDGNFIAALVNFYRSGELQRLAELAEDGERYRWLEGTSPDAARRLLLTTNNKAELDTAIDAARAKDRHDL